MIGHIDPITTGPIAGDGYYSYTGQFSDWSSTQTIYLMTTQPSPSVPEFPAVAVVSLLVFLPLIALLMKKRIFLKVY